MYSLKLFILFNLVVPGLLYRTQAFSVYSAWAYSLVAVLGLLIAVASLVVEHGL